MDLQVAEREREELYMQSVRQSPSAPSFAGQKQSHERQRQQAWWERLRYHERMIRVHTATSEVIIARHEEDAARCRHALGLEENGHNSKKLAAQGAQGRSMTIDKSRLDELEADYRARVAAVRADTTSRSWVKQELKVRELGKAYDRDRKRLAEEAA
jgi:hypothetical protein